MGDGSLLSNDARDRFRARLQPYAAGIARLGLTPNMLTLIGFGIAIVAAVAAGLQWWVAAGEPFAALLATLALNSAVMVSYTRARAEGLGFTGEVGIAPRPERIVILGAGLVATGLAGGPGGSPWLQLALGALFVLTTITVIQRIVHVRRQAAQQ